MHSTLHSLVTIFITIFTVLSAAACTVPTETNATPKGLTNPRVGGRRIHVFDLATNTNYLLNQSDSYQDTLYRAQTENNSTMSNE